MADDREDEAPIPEAVNSVELMFPSRYLKADADLAGRSVVVTIWRVVARKVKMNARGRMVEETRFVVEFVRAKKAWIVGKAAARSIVEATGEPNPHNWPGHRIELFQDLSVKNPQRPGAGGVRARRPKPAAESAPPDGGNDAPNQ